MNEWSERWRAELENWLGDRQDLGRQLATRGAVGDLEFEPGLIVARVARGHAGERMRVDVAVRTSAALDDVADAIRDDPRALTALDGGRLPVTAGDADLRSLLVPGS